MRRGNDRNRSNNNNGMIIRLIFPKQPTAACAEEAPEPIKHVELADPAGELPAATIHT